MPDFTVMSSEETSVLKQRFEYLKQSVRCMSNAIDNEGPDLALREIRRTVEIMEGWDQPHVS